MSCQHAEDVCQHCLQKVQKKTEYPYPKFCQHCYGGKEEEEDSPPPKLVVTPEKPMKARQSSISMDFYLVLLQGAMTYFAVKHFLKNLM